MDFDISEMFEEENCKYERDHWGQIKISVIPEIELSPEEKAKIRCRTWRIGSEELGKSCKNRARYEKRNFPVRKGEPFRGIARVF